MQIPKISKFRSIDKGVVFILIWAAGLSLGLYVGREFCNTLSIALLRSCFSRSAVIIPSALLPITLVWFVSRRMLPGLIFPIGFCKAFADGFIFPAIASAFGSASWLMGLLLLFTDRIATVFLIYYAVKCLMEPQRYHDRSFILFLLWIVALIAFDYFFISCNLNYLLS